MDRHLFGLYCVARGTNMDPLPDLFTDKVHVHVYCASSYIMWPCEGVIEAVGQGRVLGLGLRVEVWGCAH